MLLLSGGFSAQEGFAWDVLRQNGLTYKGAPEFMWNIRYTRGKMSKCVRAVSGKRGPCSVSLSTLCQGTWEHSHSRHSSPLLVGVTHLQ